MLVIHIKLLYKNDFKFKTIIKSENKLIKKLYNRIMTSGYSILVFLYQQFTEIFNDGFISKIC